MSIGTFYLFEKKPIYNYVFQKLVILFEEIWYSMFLLVISYFFQRPSNPSQVSLWYQEKMSPFWPLENRCIKVLFVLEVFYNLIVSLCGMFCFHSAWSDDKSQDSVANILVH